jgi:hypothetical protein
LNEGGHPFWPHTDTKVERILQKAEAYCYRAATTTRVSIDSPSPSHTRALQFLLSLRPFHAEELFFPSSSEGFFYRYPLLSDSHLTIVL